MRQTALGAAIPKALRPRTAEIAARVRDLCDAMLDPHHEEVAVAVVAALARKRPSPLLRGGRDLWAAAAVHTVVAANGGFVSDANTAVSADAFARAAGVSRRSLENKSRDVRRLLGITPFHHDWLLPATPDPFGPIAVVGGLYVDTATQLLEACRGASADVLHRILAVHRVPGTASNAADAVEVFCEVHCDDPTDADCTAVLLAVQPRWSRHARAFLEAVEGSGVVEDAQLDRTAGNLLGDVVRFEHPADWYSDGWISVALDDLDDAPDLVADPDTAEDEPVFSVHPVPPEARRWAVARLLQRGTASVAGILAATLDLTASSRPSTHRAMLDVYDRMAPDERRQALGVCLSSPAAPVRRRALEHVAREEGLERARALAAVDTDAQVRAWGRRLEEPGRRPDAQASLF